MKIRSWYSVIASTLALAIALIGVPGVTAGGILVGTKQIRNGSILTQDIRNNTIQSGDIGNGDVKPRDVEMPEPEQLQESDVAMVNAPASFVLVDTVGTYSKEDPTSILEVDWTGTAASPSQSCTFQLRVDGQPSAAGAGSVFVQLGTEQSVAASALFDGLAVGNHVVEVWAKAKTGQTAPCVVGPIGVGIPQTFVVSEQVV